VLAVVSTHYYCCHYYYYHRRRRRRRRRILFLGRTSYLSIDSICVKFVGHYVIIDL
jgi:hypothetical protein